MKLEKRKKLLAARIGLASFFEDTLHEFVKETSSKEKEVRSLGKLLRKIKSGEEIQNDQILKVAALFDDEMALDNATHTVLSNMCRYMEINNFGTTPMLRTRLYSKIRAIRREDKGIRKEGLDHIPEPLLKQLLRERGMRSDYQEWICRANMAKWLELSLDHEVPVTLLVMSRVFTIQHIPGQDATTKLKQTISTIGDATTKEMLVEKGGVEDKKAEMEIIERQQQLIDEEETLKMEMESGVGAPADLVDTVSTTRESEEAQRRMIRDVAEAVECVATDSPVDHEKHEIQEIKEKIQEMTVVTVKEMEAADTVLADDAATEDMAAEERMADAAEMEETFDLKDDEEMEFIEAVEGELAVREHTKQRVAQKIGKFVEKTSKQADETDITFANTLKGIGNLEHLSEAEFVSALKEVLELRYSDEQYGEFWKLYRARKAKDPTARTYAILEEIMDDHEDDI